MKVLIVQIVEHSIEAQQAPTGSQKVGRDSARAKQKIMNSINNWNGIANPNVTHSAIHQLASIS